MGKQITLGELGASNKNNAPKKSNNHLANQSEAMKGIKPIDRKDMLKTIAQEHPEEIAKREEENRPVSPPLVEDAFKGFFETMDKKKANADKLIEMAKSAAEEKEMQELEETSGNLDDTHTNLDEFDRDIAEAMGEDVKMNEEKMESKVNDDIEINLQIEETKSEESIKEEPKNEFEKEEVIEPSIQIKEESKPTVEEKKEDNVVPFTIPVNESTSYNDLDDLIKDIDDADIDKDSKEDASLEETPEELRERLKKSMDDITVTQDPIDFSKYTVSKKSVPVQAILNRISSVSTKRRADWPLIHSKRNMTFEETYGPELDNLRKTIQSSNGVNGVIASIRFIYDHTIDANKPPFEVWCKQIRTEDIESLYFGELLACYGGKILTTRECTNEACKKTVLINSNTAEMYKIEKDEDKELFEQLRTQDSTSHKETVNATVYQISDSLAISYMPATLYSTFIQYATLPPKITEKYNDILNTMAYIDGFFYVNKDTNQFEPIDIPKYKNNINKTVLAKLKVFIAILKTLNMDQYNIVMGKLNNLIEMPKISFIYPEAVCPECGEKLLEASVDSTLNLLFTRAQLAQVKSL